MQPKTRRSRAWKPERHRWFDQWLTAQGEGLQGLIAKTLAAIDRHEKRARARRPEDQIKHLDAVAVVVSNLAYAVIVPPPTGRIALTTGNKAKGKSRYENPALGTKPVRALIDLLEKMQFLKRHQPQAPRGEATSFAPSARFARYVVEANVGLGDFARSPDQEVVVLTRKRRLEASGRDHVSYKEYVDYRDTPQTTAYRAEMRKLNDWLRTADIEFLDDGLEPRVDPQDRILRRHFNVYGEEPESFDKGGRLFGAFWMGLKSGRRRNLRINGEPIADLDFGSMFTRLAYARLGAQAPLEDLYAIEGADGYRSGIKMAMNTFLFDTSPKRPRWPEEMGVGVGDDTDARLRRGRAADFEARLPPGWTVKKTKEAIARRHPLLKAAWGKGIGLELMFDESRVLLATLKKLMDADVPALGLHDGLMVPCSKAVLAKKLMEEAAEEVTGMPIPAEVKG